MNGLGARPPGVCRSSVSVPTRGALLPALSRACGQGIAGSDTRPAAFADPAVIREILAHLGRSPSGQKPGPRPARAHGRRALIASTRGVAAPPWHRSQLRRRGSVISGRSGCPTWSLTAVGCLATMLPGRSAECRDSRGGPCVRCGDRSWADDARRLLRGGRRSRAATEVTVLEAGKAGRRRPSLREGDLIDLANADRQRSEDGKPVYPGSTERLRLADMRLHRRGPPGRTGGHRDRHEGT
jgi:hypothetical protein